MAFESMYSVTLSGTRLEQLKALALILAERIDAGGDGHSMAQLVRQYRETLREISELEDAVDDNDEVAQIIAFRANASGAGAHSVGGA